MFAFDPIFFQRGISGTEIDKQAFFAINPGYEQFL
jgi:hypothetical protein